MNFLQIAKKVNELLGTQGEMLSVTSPVGYQANIVTAINLAYEDIQDESKEWPFMRKVSRFLTATAQEAYSPFSSAVIGSLDFGRWDIKNILYNKKGLTFSSYDRWIRRDNNTQGKPSTFSVDPGTDSLLLNLPDNIYTIDAHYYIAPHQLVLNTDTPILPIAFHNLITFKAVADVAGFLEYYSLEARFARKADKRLGELKRYSLPHKTLAPRSII